MAYKSKKEAYEKIVEKPYRPKARLTLSAKELPAIKDWDVGKTYTLEIKGKMISKSEGGWDGTQPLEGTFEVNTARNEGDYDD